VRFALDADGVLSVTAREESTGAQASIDVQPMNGLTDQEVERMLKDSFEHAREDFEASRLANLRTEISTMLRAIDKHLAEGARALDRETVHELQEAAAAARRAQASDDVRAVQQARDELERATLPLAAVLMDAVA